MLLISSEVKYRVTDHDIDKGIWEGDLLNGSNLKIFYRESSPQRSGKPSYMLYTIAVLVECKYLAAFAQQVDQITPISASSIKNPHSRCDVPSQNLIEYVNIDLSKLLLNAKTHSATISAAAALWAPVHSPQFRDLRKASAQLPPLTM